MPSRSPSRRSTASPSAAGGSAAERAAADPRARPRSARSRSSRRRSSRATRGLRDGDRRGDVARRGSGGRAPARLRGARGAHRRAGRGVEHRAAELAVGLAEKILAVSLELRPELVARLAAGALRGLTERDHVVVEVSPDDLEVVTAAREDLVERLGGFTRVEIVPERRVARGGFVVQTSEGEIDASTRRPARARAPRIDPARRVGRA